MSQDLMMKNNRVNRKSILVMAESVAVITNSGEGEAAVDAQPTVMHAQHPGVVTVVGQEGCQLKLCVSHQM